MTLRLIPAFFPLVGAALLVAACGSQKTALSPVAPAAQVKAALTGDEASKEALFQLYAAARAGKEPGATIYVASVPEELKPLADAFAADFPGLKADYQRFIGDKLLARLDGEFASGKHSGDVVLPSIIEARRLASVGRLQAWTPPTAATLPADYRDPKGFFTAPYRKAFTLSYNPTLVPPGEIPATVKDVLQAKWQGRYTFPSSGATSPSAWAFSELARRGEVTDTEVVAFDKYGSGGPPSSELIPAVAQGRYAFALWTNAAAVIAQRDEGAPLQIAFSPKLSVLASVGSGVLADAPHPNSAKLFTAWLLTPKAQKILTELHFYAADPTAPAPEGFPPVSQFLNGDTPEDVAYADRIQAFQKRRATLVVASR